MSEFEDERVAETSAFLAVLHAVHELCEARAPHAAIDAAVTMNAREFAERGIAFLTRLQSAEAERDVARNVAFDDGRRAAFSQIYTMVQEAPKTWSTDQVLNEIVATVKP